MSPELLKAVRYGVPETPVSWIGDSTPALREMLAQAEVAPELIDRLLSRLETFVHPFTASLGETEQKRHTV